MPVLKVLNKGRVPVKIWTEDVESSALDQLANIANLPFVFKHVAVMPDVHLGKGATVGSVIATKNAISPAAVGVDLGCGMCAAKIQGVKASDIDNLDELRHSIERSIPLGPESFQPSGIPKESKEWDGWANWGGLTEKVKDKRRKAETQLGTLGGGNHFVEICLDENDEVWVMLHSGSRNIGKSIAEVHIDLAKGLMKKMFIHLPDPDLAYLAMGTPEYKNYLSDLKWAQAYAFKNRQVMMSSVVKDLFHHLKRSIVIETLVNCHHNFVEWENHYGENVLVTRKGAIRARVGDMGIIPGSMGTKSYIVEGLSNPESFNSCSHGAGRRMSRSEAKRRFTMDDLIEQTKGIECRKDSGVIDEIPGAYKDIDTVISNSSDLIKVRAVLHQILCIKG